MSFTGLMARKGVLKTFSKTVPGTYDASTDTSTSPTTLSVQGYTMQIAGDPDLYNRLQLIESDNPTLLFRPIVPGQIPVLGMTVAWGNDPALTVKYVTPLAMNGTPEAAKLVVSR